MDYIVACPDPELPGALCAFADQLATLPGALAGVAAFTQDHQAWFRLWLPLGRTTPSRDTSLPGLRELVLALDGKGARRSGDQAASRRRLHLVSAFLMREGLPPTGSRATPKATGWRPSPACSTA